MKLHLPLLLRSALLTLLICSAPSARAYDVFFDEATGYVCVRQDYVGETFPTSVTYSAPLDYVGGSEGIRSRVRYYTLNEPQDGAPYYTTNTAWTSLTFTGSSFVVSDNTAEALSCDAGKGVQMKGCGYVEFARNNGAFTNKSKALFMDNGDIKFIANSKSGNGGAIFEYAELTFERNGDILFSKNTSGGEGGAIYVYGGDLSFSGNGNITFSGNSAKSSGGAIQSSRYNVSFSLNDKKLEFSGNRSETGSGGAIAFWGGTFSFSSAKEITFSGNSAYGNGGVVSGNWSSSLSFSDNDKITFSNNTAQGSTGGAISSGGAVDFSNNGDIDFSGNTSGGKGGAIYIDGGAVQFSNNGDITFSGNTAKKSGGAVNSSGGTLSFTENGHIHFTGNTATEEGGALSVYKASIIGNKNIFFDNNSSDKSSGGICVGGKTLTLVNNWNISFADNSSILGGGSIGNFGVLALNNNRDIDFSRNSAGREGGAIYNLSLSTVTLSDNWNIDFTGNSATGDGGAIYSGQMTVSGNRDIAFTGNTSSSKGGAVYDNKELTLCSNGKIDFIGNTAQLGGAIYNTSTLTITGNGDVTFRGNVETKDKRLRGLYSAGGTVTLSAAEEKSITIYDSIYTSRDAKLELNKDGGAGAIVFTGTTTEADWKAAFGNETPTAEQITTSRTSEILGTNTLYGGSLVVKEEAVLKASSLSVNNGAGATIELDNGHMQLTGKLNLNQGNALHMQQGYIDSGTVILGAGSSLQAEGGCSTVSAALTMGADSFFLFDLGENKKEQDAVPLLIVSGKLTQEKNLNIKITSATAPEAHRQTALLRADNYDKGAWTAGRVQVESEDYGYSNLRWIGNTLYLSAPDDVYFYGTDGYVTKAWNGADTWAHDNTYAESCTFLRGDKIHFERGGRISVAETTETHSMYVNLAAPLDRVTVDIAWDASLSIDKTLHLGQGDLSIYASPIVQANVLNFNDKASTDSQIHFEGKKAEASLHLHGNQDFSGMTIEWDTPDAGTLYQGLFDGGWATAFNFDINTTKLVIKDTAVWGNNNSWKLMDIDHDTVMFNGTYAVNISGKQGYNYNPYQAWLRRNNLTSEYGDNGTTAFIFLGDLYYGRVQADDLRGLSDKGTWWAPANGKRVVYDTEKMSYSTGGQTHTLPADYEKKDKASCALCVGMNMAAFWLDKYAPLMNTGAKPIALTAGSSSAASNVLSNDLYLKYWKNDDDYKNAYSSLRWLLTGKGANHPYAVMPEDWWRMETMSSVSYSFEPESGVIYTCSNGGDPIYGGSFTNMMIAAFACSDTPVALGYRQQFTNKGGKITNHVVTCWGYETGWVDNRKIITKLWFTDSDDSICYGTSKQVFDVVYDINGVYLLKQEKGDNLIFMVSEITFMTTPDGMDEMLAQYNSSKTPIYWTGQSGDGLWGTDSTITYGADGNIERQTRLSEYADGWSKYCSAAGKEVWANTVFTGQESTLCFADVVNGEKLTTAQKQVHTLGVDAKGTDVVVKGKGYSFLPGGPGEAATISLDCVSLVDGASLQIGEGVTLDAPVLLFDKSVLENHGTIKQTVKLDSGATFISGLVQVTVSNAGGSYLGDGFYVWTEDSGLAGNGKVELLDGSGTYTLGTTFDLAYLTRTEKVDFKFNLSTPEDSKDYILNLLGITDASGKNFKFEFRYIHDSIFEEAQDILSGSQTALFASGMEISGGADEAITVGSGMNEGDSAAKIQISETLGGQVAAADARLATVAGEDVYFCAETSLSLHSRLHHPMFFITD